MNARTFNTPLTATTKDEWLTPPDIIRALGDFDLDPCAPVNRPWDMAKSHYSIADNGLALPWFGRVWLNPPYGDETFKWIQRGAAHGNAMCLIFARTETKGFHNEVWAKADAIFFFKGRLKFFHVDGREAGGAANAPSCIVAYGSSNVEALRRAASTGLLRGRFIPLKSAMPPALPPPEAEDATGAFPSLPFADLARPSAFRPDDPPRFTA
ncbi:DNA N-6-adenine-methyltransferase [Hyphomicrobium sp. DY-1]|uniref:DNA N-6-adenine-methyltransferase n=1 Tax=Hyphomicrobium sp. DY-1 TaxID=3075650 RepID=UPI0039C30280